MVRNRVAVVASISIFFAAACSTTKKKYYLNLGPRIERYHEVLKTGSFDRFVSGDGTQVTVTEGPTNEMKLNGFGFNVGLTEEMPNGLASKLSLYYVNLGSVFYAFDFSGPNGSGSTSGPVSFSAFGLDGSIGFRFLIFEPHVSYKLEWLNATMITSSSVLGYYLGGGLSIVVPFSKKFRLFSTLDYRIAMNSKDSVVRTLTLIAGVEVFAFK